MKRWLLVAVLGAAGCGDEVNEDVSVGADACEHFGGGPIEALQAGATSELAVDASAEHTRFDLTVPAAGGGPRVGYVAVAIAEAGEHVFFFDGAVALAVSDGLGNPVAIEETVTGDPDCATIASGFFVDLEVGSYVLEIKPQVDDELVQFLYFGVGAEGHGH